MSDTPTGAPERVRFTIDLPEDWRDYMATLARTHKVTQGELFEAMLKSLYQLPAGALDEQALAIHAAKKQARSAAREERRKLLEAVKNLDPRKQAELLAQQPKVAP